jgi:alginate O-acetyltransferase complex protein AlgI
MIRFFQICFGQEGSFHDFVTISALMDNCWLWVICLLFCMPLRHWTDELLQRIAHQGGFVHESLLFVSRLMISAVLLVLSVALLVGATNNAFIYTRF